jgi:hypothetical protein
MDRALDGRLVLHRGLDAIRLRRVCNGEEDSLMEVCGPCAKYTSNKRVGQSFKPRLVQYYFRQRMMLSLAYAVVVDAIS